MEMHQVRYFMAVAEALNFTRAAEKCNVSQPALTRAIQGLEDELGGPLFHRERNNTHLTELGRMMQPYLGEVWAQSQQAKARAKAFANMAEAPLAIGVMCSIGPAKLLDLFNGFRERNPGVQIHFRDASGAKLTEWLTRGELDIAIFGQPDPIDERFHALELFREKFVIGLAPDHRLCKANAIKMADLDGERYLWRTTCEFTDFMEREYESRGVKIKLAYRSDRDDWIQAMARAGLGFTFIPEFAVTVDGLQVRPLIDPEVTRVVNLVTVRGRPQTPPVGAFVREAMKWRAKPGKKA